MDALACGVPFITNNIKPATEYLETYPDLGILVNFSDPKWPILLRKRISSFKFERFEASSKAFHSNYTEEHVEDSMVKIFED